MELFKPCNYFSVAINVFSLLVRPEISKRNSEFFYHEEYKEGIVTCTVREANPKPVINWYSQELRKIDDNPKQDKWIRSNLKQSLTSFLGGKYKSTLTIPVNQGKSFYICNATNSAGSSTRVYKFLRYSKYFICLYGLQLFNYALKLKRSLRVKTCM